MSTYTKRHSVQDMIRRRMEKNRKFKEKKGGNLDIETYLEDLLEKVNKTLASAKNELDRYWTVDDLPGKVLKDITPMDPGASISLNWRGEDAETLVLESVTIEWSEKTREEKGFPVSTHVDVTSRIIREMLG